MDLRAAVAVVFLTATGSAGAQLYKCVGKDGRVAYQAEPCAESALELRLKAPVADAAESGPGGLKLVDVTQAARRISNRQGRPTVVLLYSTTCPLSRKMFPEFVAIASQYRARGIEFIVLSTDEEENFDRVAPFVAAHKSSFEPVAIKPWSEGSLVRAMAPLGIQIGMNWTMPLVAVRDANGRVVRKTEATTDLSSLRATLDTLAR